MEIGNRCMVLVHYSTPRYILYLMNTAYIALHKHVKSINVMHRSSIVYLRRGGRLYDHSTKSMTITLI